MELPLRPLELERRTPNWLVAAVSGLAAGAVLMVLDLVWSSLVAGGGPWQTSHMIAPIFMKSQAPAPPQAAYPFSLGVVWVALAVHYALGVMFGLILVAIMTPLNLDATMTRAIMTGLAFGLALYIVNFYGMAQLFPWLVDMRSWPTVMAHLVFGMVAALLYWKLTERQRASSVAL